MTCPHCHAETESSEPKCVQCGKVLTDLYNAETLADAKPVLAGTEPTETQGRSPSGGVAAQYSSVFSLRLEPGAEFGPRYRIESLLGEGGMGLVYKAVDLDLGRVVALKLIRPGLTSSPEMRQRFKQELLLASRVSHKNVLRIHDLGEVGGVKFISMAYVEGEDLQSLLSKQGRLPVEQTLKLARQLCSALDAAHSEGIVHRDLKPQNVLIDREGNARISDFGLAKTLEAGAQQMTLTGQILGTPRYMSPEQALGREVDTRSDLYSLGLIFYEMVAGDLPFRKNSPLVLQWTREKPKNPKTLNPDIPDYLARIILRCLEADPDRRYQSAHELLEDLDREQASRSPRSNVHINLPMPEKHGRLYVGVAAGLLLTLALVLIFVHRAPRPGKMAARTKIAGIPSLTEGKYLAVLPFGILGSKGSLGYVAEGLNESLAARLFGMAGVHLISSSAVRGEDHNQPVSKIARDLGVNLIVQGTVQGGAGGIAIVVKLQNLTNGHLMWVREFTGMPQDLLTIEDQISNSLVAALQLHPGTTEVAREAAPPTENIAAYQLYLKGQDAMRGLPTARTIKTAINYYQKALKQDSSFALAYAGLANASLQMYNQRKDRFWVEQALNAAQQAEQLGSNQPQVYMALGNVYSATGRNAQAIADLKRAAKMAPTSDEPFRLLGEAYRANGQLKLALAALQKADRIDPYYWVNWDDLAKAYVAEGDYDAALVALHRVVQIEPDNAAGHENIGFVCLERCKYEQAIPSLEKALALAPTFTHYTNLAIAYFFAGRHREAVNMFKKATALSPNQEWVVGDLAEAYLFTGDKEKARETYNRAIELAYKQLQVNPRDAEVMADLSQYLANTGRPSQALEFVQNARSISPDNPQYAYDEAVVQTLTGNPTLAVKSLREAFQNHFPAQQAIFDPELASLQSRPDFKALLKEFGVKMR